MAEHPAVNRTVVGSSPTLAAITAEITVQSRWDPTGCLVYASIDFAAIMSASA